MAMQSRSKEYDSDIGDFMRVNESMLHRLLPEVIEKKRYCALVEQYLGENQYLMDADRKSLCKAIFDAAAMGLEIGSPLRHAGLMTFKSKSNAAPVVKLFIEYRGYTALCFRSGQIQALAAHAVYDQDYFKFQYGSKKFIDHKPTTGERGRLCAAYAIAHLKNGQFDFEVIDSTGAARAKKDSPTAKKSSSPWNTRPDTMWIKTAVRRLSGRLPQCAIDQSQINSAPAKSTTAPDAEDIFNQYAMAIENAPELNQQALKIMHIDTPTDAEKRYVLYLMRHLYRQKESFETAENH